jgi:DUF971 family protein
MARATPVPTEIRRLGVQSVRIAWADGHHSEYDNRYLREHCPCAVCRERPKHSLPLASGQGAEIYPVQMSIVGRYAVSIQWSDGHDTGIYSYQTLREICPCPACRALQGTETA